MRLTNFKLNKERRVVKDKLRRMKLRNNKCSEKNKYYKVFDIVAEIAPNSSASFP